MGLPFFVNSSFLIQGAIYFDTAPFFMGSHLSQDLTFNCFVVDLGKTMI